MQPVSFKSACKRAFKQSMRDGRPRYVFSLIPHLRHYHVQVRMPKVSFTMIGNVGFGFGFWHNGACSIKSYHGFPVETAKLFGSTKIMGEGN